MNNIVTIPELDEGEWPVEFTEMWMNIFHNVNRRVFALYDNSDNPQGEIIESESSLSVNAPEDLPDAYISIDELTGRISEIYVKSDKRGRGLGTMLCAFSRSYLLNSGIIVVAPSGMTAGASGLFQHISTMYGEPYVETQLVPLFCVYTDFNGGWTISKIEEWKL